MLWTAAAGHKPAAALTQLQPEVEPHPSHTKHDPAGRIFVPHVKHSGESTAEPVISSSSSAVVCAVTGAGFAATSSDATGAGVVFSDSASGTSAPSSSAGSAYDPVSSCRRRSSAE